MKRHRWEQQDDPNEYRCRDCGKSVSVHRSLNHFIDDSEEFIRVLTRRKGGNPVSWPDSETEVYSDCGLEVSCTVMSE